MPGADFRSDIQGMRAVAILLVVFFHSGVSALPGGFVGVDVFFVISGYLITSILLGEATRTHKVDLVSFYAKRLKRLLPASLVMIISVLLLTYFFLSPIEQKTIATTGVATSFYASNFWFAVSAGDYFADSSALNPFLHTWSLAVEEQFYLVWPVFIMLGWSRPKLAIGLLVLVSFALCLWLMRGHNVWAFYSSPSRAWEFGVGGVACTLNKAMLTRLRPFAAAIAFVGLVAISGSALLLTETSPFPGFLATIPVLGTAAVLVAGAIGQNFVTSALSTKVLTFIGDISYSWYLWHWPVLVFSELLFPELPSGLTLVVGLASIIPAYASYLFVENGVRRSPFFARKPIAAIGLGVALTLAGGALSLGARIQSGAELSSSTQVPIVSARETLSISAANNCQSDYEELEVHECVFGDPGGVPVVLFGDSHAAHWSTVMATIAEDLGWKLTVIVKSSCPVAQIPAIYHEPTRQTLEVCPEWRNAAIDRIVELKPKYVFLASASHYVPKDGPTTLLEPIAPDEWTAALKSTMDTILAAGSTPVVIRDIPKYPFDVPICLSRLARHSGSADAQCDAPPEEILNERMIQAEQAALELTPGAKLLDLTPLFCGEICSSSRLGVPLYRDDSHVSIDYANIILPEIERQMPQ